MYTRRIYLAIWLGIVAAAIALGCHDFTAEANEVNTTKIQREEAHQNPETPLQPENSLVTTPEEEQSATLPGSDPAKVVDSIASRANDWQEPSKRSEERYVLAIRQWLNSLEPGKRERARKILLDAHPKLRSLRMAIHEKKQQLVNISFNQYTNPETLPKLGKELQNLRTALRAQLQKVREQLKREAGVPMDPLGEDGFWLSPPDDPYDPDSQSQILPVQTFDLA